MPQARRFMQVDVFTRVPFLGNPLAVVLDAEGLDDARMQAIARWTHLSETSFVLAPTHPAADYRLRIFSPTQEFAFAGHPTLGSAHAVLESGLQPKNPGRLVQQCGVGLVTVDLPGDGSLAFQAPDARLLEWGAERRSLVDAVLGGRGRSPVAVEMGIRWLTVEMESAAACLDACPDATALHALCVEGGVDGIALYGRHAEGFACDYEVRTFWVEHGRLAEDPVTGSANAAIARVLQARGFAGGAGLSGGHSVTVIEGEIRA
jgi:PhzF family phenazine biosynthesis protein